MTGTSVSTTESSRSGATLPDPGPPDVGLHPGLTLGVVCAAVFMLLLDVTIVSVALADLQRDLGASLADLQWVVDAYTLTLAGGLLTAATLGDRIGRRRIFLAGLACASAPRCHSSVMPSRTPHGGRGRSACSVPVWRLRRRSAR